MGWTDERVDLLKKLWMEGLSASQIAAELGGGVTRNAVIGKVHRLKLSARAKPAASAARPRPSQPRPSQSANRSRPQANMSAGARAVTKSRSMGGGQIVGATALKASAMTEEELQMAPETAMEIEIPVAERIGLMQLTEATCKWPIGDPLNSDFHFCGQHSLEGKPYCDFHARRAYHTIDRRR